MRMFCKRRFEDQRSASVLAVIIGLFLTCGAAKALADEELREWGDTTGGHKLTARLQAFSKGGVTLETADGKLMEIQIEKLSAKDRDYVLTHHADLKKADDNPFKETNAVKLEKLEAKLEKLEAKLEKLESKLKAIQRQVGDNAAKAKELEAKLEACQRQVDVMDQQLILDKLRAAAARADALLLDQQFSKVEVSCMEEQVRGAEGNLKVWDARREAGTVGGAGPLEAKAGLCMFKGCLAWVKGDLRQCQKEYDDAAAACKERAEIARAQYRAGSVDLSTVFAAEAEAKEAELFASRVKGRIAARKSQPDK